MLAINWNRNWNVFLAAELSSGCLGLSSVSREASMGKKEERKKGRESTRYDFAMKSIAHAKTGIGYANKVYSPVSKAQKRLSSERGGSLWSCSPCLEHTRTRFVFLSRLYGANYPPRISRLKSHKLSFRLEINDSAGLLEGKRSSRKSHNALC